MVIIFDVIYFGSFVDFDLIEGNVIIEDVGFLVGLIFGLISSLFVDNICMLVFVGMLVLFYLLDNIMI